MRAFAPLLLLLALGLAAQKSNAARLLVESSVQDQQVILEAVGEYAEDGTAFNAPRYKLESPKMTRFLYRAKTGQWTITGKETNIEASKGTIVSLKPSSTPFTATFKYYDTGNKKWHVDASFNISSLSDVVDDKKPPSASSSTAGMILEDGPGTTLVGDTKEELDQQGQLQQQVNFSFTD
jgi:hypothetical protein